MARRAQKRRLGVEDEYWQLVMAGGGSVEARRRVGIGRRPATDGAQNAWPPVVATWPKPIGRVATLSLLERQRIATLRRQGTTIREIALLLAAHRRRSAESCGARPPATTSAATTATSPTAEQWNWSGAQSRSRPGCATSSGTGADLPRLRDDR